MYIFRICVVDEFLNHVLLINITQIWLHFTLQIQTDGDDSVYAEQQPTFNKQSRRQKPSVPKGDHLRRPNLKIAPLL